MFEEICRPYGTRERAMACLATHIALLRSDNPLFFNAMEELNSPAPRRGVSRIAASNHDSPTGRGKGWVVNNLLGTKD